MQHSRSNASIALEFRLRQVHACSKVSLPILYASQLSSVARFSFWHLDTDDAVLHFEYLALPNQVGNLWRLHPEVLTVVVTLIATVLSVATTLCVCPSTLPNCFSAMSFFKFLHDFCQGSTKTSNEGSYLSIPTEYWYLFVPGLSYYATWTP
ncbi:hypothetical protein P692DRAFT_20574406 [Suillus brevipes Sb2]|nr:hypothetical protein P692DRAFT_20574406 [Suillus brevipes Sb2]